MNFEEFKRKEYIGDALAGFLSAILVCNNGNNRERERNIQSEIKSNFNFTDVAKKIGLKPHPEDGFIHPIKIDKRYANAYEAHLYEYYQKNGFVKTLEYFNNTAVANYYKRPIQLQAGHKKEAIYELQRIDCNCNDCHFLDRDLSRPPQKGVPNPINYGNCKKFKKSISFIPATCQIETQKCFVHRKDVA